MSKISIKGKTQYINIESSEVANTENINTATSHDRNVPENNDFPMLLLTASGILVAILMVWAQVWTSIAIEIEDKHLTSNITSNITPAAPFTPAPYALTPQALFTPAALALTFIYYAILASFVSFGILLAFRNFNFLRRLGAVLLAFSIILAFVEVFLTAISTIGKTLADPANLLWPWQTSLNWVTKLPLPLLIVFVPVLLLAILFGLSYCTKSGINAVFRRLGLPEGR